MHTKYTDTHIMYSKETQSIHLSIDRVHVLQTCGLTCAFFDAGSFLHCVPTELALEVILPELRKPDIPPVVL